MLDISGDRGVLKDVIREGSGELVTPDASVLGMRVSLEGSKFPFRCCGGREASLAGCGCFKGLKVLF